MKIELKKDKSILRRETVQSDNCALQGTRLVVQHDMDCRLLLLHDKDCRLRRRQILKNIFESIRAIMKFTRN